MPPVISLSSRLDLVAGEVKECGFDLFRDSHWIVVMQRFDAGGCSCEDRRSEFGDSTLTLLDGLA